MSECTQALPGRNSSPLDTLKHTLLRVDQLIEHAIETHSTDTDVPADDPVVGILDSARRLLTVGLAEHVPGISWDGTSMQVSPGSESLLWRYDDGTPVAVAIDDGVMRWVIFPRLDPELLDAANRQALLGRPTLSLVPPPEEGEDG